MRTDTNLYFSYIDSKIGNERYFTNHTITFSGTICFYYFTKVGWKRVWNISITLHHHIWNVCSQSDEQTCGEWSTARPENKIKKKHHSQLFSILQLQIAHMTKSEMGYLDFGLFGPILLFLNQYFNNFLPEIFVLWIAFIWCTYDLFIYCAQVSDDFCTYITRTHIRRFVNDFNCLHFFSL